ncbi:MAG: hypothetical protein BWY74_00156 [Firmicutes bacterium ADurb.Bin419]|nr:MAG: hypothetical protein BWY74_00156 [Firmicutes bacterium ADurb.Bin419]
MKIIFYIGESVEEWSPKSMATGIGGSEEATIQMAGKLAQLGHNISVYNRCGDDEGEYDGVNYLNYESYNDDHADILILWRGGRQYLDIIKNSKAKKKYIWLHDTTQEAEILPIIYMVDKVMVLSKYHRLLYPNIEDSKMFITQNGVDISQFDLKVKRNPYRIIYMSSYDRGLKELLESWTEIKLAVPEATLHIFYGWQTADALLGMTDEYKIFKSYMQDLFKQEGVHHHGRVGHKELAKEIMKSGVWAYPTHWPEISCISAMKAQIGGAIPVIIPTAATKETTMWGKTTNLSYDDFKDRNLPESVTDLFNKNLIKALDPKYQESYRDKMMEDARKKFDWAKVAKQWDTEFEGAK